MSWIFRKVFRSGPFRTTVSKGGVGMSWGIPGFRFGISPSGRKYISIGIPGTGLYFIKYLDSKSNSQKPQTKGNINKPTETKKVNNVNESPWWEQKNL
jgi:hypothetical protein